LNREPYALKGASTVRGGEAHLRFLLHSELPPASAISPSILDACSRKVVGYALSRRLDTPLALAALRSALASRRPSSGCIHHTDRGCQYASETYRRALDVAGLRGCEIALNIDPVANRLQAFDLVHQFVKSVGSLSVRTGTALFPWIILTNQYASPHDGGVNFRRAFTAMSRYRRRKAVGFAALLSVADGHGFPFRHGLQAVVSDTESRAL